MSQKEITKSDLTSDELTQLRSLNETGLFNWSHRHNEKLRLSIINSLLRKGLISGYQATELGKKISQ